MSFRSLNLKARLESFSAQRRSPEPTEESVKEVDEKLAIKDDVVEAEADEKLEDPTLAPGELTYDEGVYRSNFAMQRALMNCVKRRPEGWVGILVSSPARCLCAS